MPGDAAHRGDSCGGHTQSSPGPLSLWPSPSLPSMTSHEQAAAPVQPGPACPLINVIRKVSRPDACSGSWSIASSSAACSGADGAAGEPGGTLSPSWGCGTRWGRGACATRGLILHPQARPGAGRPQLGVWAAARGYRAERHPCPRDPSVPPQCPQAGVPVMLSPLPPATMARGALPHGVLPHSRDLGLGTSC